MALHCWNFAIQYWNTFLTNLVMLYHLMCFLIYVFANNLYLLCILFCRLEIMLDESKFKQFAYLLKWVMLETTHYINNAFGPKITLTNVRAVVAIQEVLQRRQEP